MVGGGPRAGPAPGSDCLPEVHRRASCGNSALTLGAAIMNPQESSKGKFLRKTELFVSGLAFGLICDREFLSSSCTNDHEVAMQGACPQATRRPLLSLRGGLSLPAPASQVWLLPVLRLLTMA